MVAVLGKLHRVLSPEDLEIPGLQAFGEFLDLVACIVDVELPPDIGTGFLQHRGQGVAQNTAPGVAHVHGAGGVGGDEFHHVFLAGEHVVFPVVRPRLLHGADGLTEPAGAQGEIQKTGARHGGGGKVAAGKVHVVQQDLGHLPGIFAQGLGGGQAEGGGVVAVGSVLGDFHRGLHGTIGGQKSGCGGRLVGGQGQLQHLILGVLYHIHSSYSLNFL